MSWRLSFQLLTSPSSKRAQCGLSRRGGELLDRRQGQGGDVALARQRLSKAVVVLQTRGGEHRIDEGRIVLGIELQGIPRLIGRRRAVEAEREMDGLLVRPGRVQVDVLDDLGEHRLAAGLDRGARSEIDRHDVAGRLFGRQRVDGALDPARGGGGEIEIAIDAVERPDAAELGEPRIDRPADRAEFRIGGVAERQHAERHAVEPRRRRRPSARHRRGPPVREARLRPRSRRPRSGGAASVRSLAARSAKSTSFGRKPLLRASFAASPATRSALPDLLAYTIVIGSAGRAWGWAGAGCAAASTPARKPESQARWSGVAMLRTRSRLAISSSPKGAVRGRRAVVAIPELSAREPRESTRMFFL